MTATEQFIEDAIKGGWKSDCKGWYFWADKVTHTGTNGFNEQSITYEKILLDPLAWQAVGETRGWSKRQGGLDLAVRIAMHDLMSFLCDGMSIEEALATTSDDHYLS